MKPVGGSRPRIQSARMPTWFVTPARLGSLCDPPTPGHHGPFPQARFRDTGFPRPHPSSASRHPVHESIARSGASSRDRGFLHRRLSTISGDTLGIALCTSGSNPSHPAAQSPCIKFRRKFHHRSNELEKSFRRTREADSVPYADTCIYAVTMPQCTSTQLSTRHSLHVVIRHSSHTDRREKTVDLHMLVQMIGPAV